MATAPAATDLTRTDTDVLILGAGVIGLSCALRLLQAGRGVTLVDRGNAAGVTSQGSCGTITPSHAPPLAMPGVMAQSLRWMLQSDAPLYIKPTLNPRRLRWFWRFTRKCRPDIMLQATHWRAGLLKQSRQLLQQLINDESFNCEFQGRGSLYLWRDEQALAASRWLPELLEQVDIPIHAVDGDAIRELEPAVHESIVGGYHNTLDARLRPESYLAELRHRVQSLGAKIVEFNAVESLRSDGDRITAAITAQGPIQAREYIMALGAWSPLLGRKLQLDIPIQPGKGYSITFNRPKVCPEIPLVLEERSVCVTTWESGFRLGSTMEFSGYDTSLNRRRLDALVRAAGDYLREPHGEQRQTEWYGWRPMTCDELPIIGRSPKHQNLTLATGHGMLGVSMSAITGQLVKELLCGEQTSLDLKPFSPARF